jgi:hypothetical protein
MPGIPTHFLLLKHANDELFKIDPANLSYGYLGAVGASLGDFIANSDSGAPVPDLSPYWKIWHHDERGYPERPVCFVEVQSRDRRPAPQAEREPRRRQSFRHRAPSIPNPTNARCKTCHTPTIRSATSPRSEIG